MSTYRTCAPSKVNLCLYVGAPRADGLHELVSVVQPLSLADKLELVVGPTGLDQDEVVCEGVSGPNLAARALQEFRAATGWSGPPVRLTVTKKIPVAAGMGGGSADAAAALRLIAHVSQVDLPHLSVEKLLRTIGPKLGADVSALLTADRTLMTGSGENVTVLAPSEHSAFVIVPSPRALSTADVYREFDRARALRPHSELRALEQRILKEIDSDRDLPLPLLENDLGASAQRLCPEIGRTLKDVEAAGADRALVSGSGPTVFGVLRGDQAVRRAQDVADLLTKQRIEAIVATPAGSSMTSINRSL